MTGRCILARLLVGALLLALSPPSAGRADAIELPPARCPDGLRPGSSHGGPSCTVVPCDASRACEGWTRCEPQRYCRHVRRAGGDVPRDATEVVYTHACTTDADCATHDRCEALDHCTPLLDTRAGRALPIALALALCLALGVSITLRTRRARTSSTRG
ncbi:MAG: hypothetical protein U0353_18990 [Sandaracinus sp.]